MRQRITILTIMAFLILIALPLAHAKTYEVDSLSDFRNAIQHATNGDEIRFTDDVTIDFAYLDSFHYMNDNGNGQYYGYRTWTIANISLIITANQGVNAKIKNGEIVLSNADGTVITGIKIENSDIVLLKDSDDVTITDSTIQNGYIEIKENSDNYIIQNNVFTGRSALYIYDTQGTINGAVQNNALNGLPIAYLQEGQCSLTGGDYGEIVAVKCSNLNLQDITINSNTVERSQTFIMLSQVDKATLTNIRINQPPNDYIIRIYKGKDITITSSTLNDTKIIAEYTDGLTLRNNDIKAYNVYILFTWKNTNNIRLENNNFTFKTQAFYFTQGENLWITGNTFNHSANIWGIEIRDFNNTYITNNYFTNGDPEHQWRNGQLYIYYPSTSHGHTIVIANNTFTSAPFYSANERVKYMEGVSIGNRTDIKIINNTLTWLNEGITLRNVTNVLLQDNKISNTYYALTLSGGQYTHSRNITVKNNLLNNSRNTLTISYESYDVQIVGNTFTNPPTHPFYYKYIVFDYARYHNLSIYMNLFLNLTNDNKITRYYTSTKINETFKSPTPVTYTYNGVQHTGYVGNYYDDYNGTDNNQDGIGDTPYTVYTDIYPPITIIDENPIISPNIIYQWLGIVQTQSNPQGSTGGQANQTNTTQLQPIQFDEEKRKASKEAKKIDEKLDDITKELLESQGTIQLNNPEEIRQLLTDMGIDNVFEELVEKGLIREVIKLPPQGVSDLRRLLENIYGPLLINYPDPEGRLYLLYLLYYTQ